jgi:flavin-dependent dehydrogenase
MARRYDLVIVGAGPAGLGACLKATSVGLKVALIERRSKLSPLTRACSEGLLFEEFYNGDSVRVNHQEGCIEFVENKYSLKYTGKWGESPYFANISYKGKRMKIVREDHKPIHLLFDKAKCLEENLEEVINKGASFFPNQMVTDVECSAEGVTVETNKGSYAGRFLIVADGINSLCARITGFNLNRQFKGTLTGACWHIRGYEPDEDAHIHLVEGSDAYPIFCLCPTVEKGKYNLFIGSYSHQPSYWERFEQVKNNSVLSPYFAKEVEVMHRLACVLNSYHPITNPCRDNIFVIGDAAKGSSNSHAALTGFKAVECIDNALKEKREGEDFYQEYRAWWDKNFIQYLSPSSGGNFLEELSRDELDELFSYMPDEIEASMEPKKAGELLGKFFQNLLPEIQSKNHRLFQKIIAIQQKGPEEAWKERREMGFPTRKQIERH